MRLALLLLPTLAVSASCATDGPAQTSAARQSGQCFPAGAVNNFRPVGRDAVDVSISRNRVWRLTLSAGCFDVDWAQRVALRARSGGFICGPADAELIVPSASGSIPDRCLVTDVRRLSDAEIEAARRSRN